MISSDYGSDDIRAVFLKLDRHPSPLIESSSLSFLRNNKNNHSNNQNNMKVAGYISYSNALNQADNAATSRHVEEYLLAPTVLVLITSCLLNAHLCTLTAEDG